MGIERTRLRLSDFGRACEALADLSESGLCRLLHRFEVHWKRGRDYVHSPDPDYLAKLAYNRTILLKVLSELDRFAFLFQDEMTYSRHPSVAFAYEAAGAAQPRARRSYQKEKETRLAATLDLRDGRVHFWQGKTFGIEALVSFYQQLRESMPEPQRLYIEVDNWPVHFHPDVLVALEPQQFPWPVYRPSNWPKEPRRKAQEKWGGLNLPIQLLPLPTYAPWTNPIEKLWRWLRQEVLHHHRLSEQLDTLREQVARFLQRFAQGSKDLLKYVGLSDPECLYASAQYLLPKLC